jgi:hypothetical protein
LFKLTNKYAFGEFAPIKFLKELLFEIDSICLSGKKFAYKSHPLVFDHNTNQSNKKAEI